MGIVNRVEELLKSYDIDYEKEFFEEDDTTEFRFTIGKKGIIVAYDKKTDEPDDYDSFMGGFENELGVMSDSGMYRNIDDALLDMAMVLKFKIKSTHYKGIQ